MLNRREWLRQTITGAAAAVATGALSRRLLAESADAPPTTIVVYKSPTCGCCHEWIRHMEANGYRITARDINDLTEVKSNLGVPTALESCHTGVMGRYLIEGHVPADLVKKMERERPNILGLAVPGMPQGSPGMDFGRKEPYDVFAFERSGRTSVYAHR